MKNVKFQLETLRREANEELKKILKAKEISEDDEKSSVKKSSNNYR